MNIEFRIIIKVEKSNQIEVNVWFYIFISLFNVYLLQADSQFKNKKQMPILFVAFSMGIAQSLFIIWER